MHFKTPFKIAATGVLAPVMVNQKRQSYPPFVGPRTAVGQDDGTRRFSSTESVVGSCVFRAPCVQGGSGRHKADLQIFSRKVHALMGPVLGVSMDH